MEVVVQPNGPNRFGDSRPSCDQLREWVDAGYSNEQIGVLAGEYASTTPATKQTVGYWLKRCDISRPKTRADNLDHSEYRPWRVKPQHANSDIDHRLYDLSRLKQRPEMVSASNRRLVEEFVQALRDEDVVVDYNPNSKKGWVTRHRDPKLDAPDAIIRRPR